MKPIETHTPDALRDLEPATQAETTGRPAYTPPRLERLGDWSALTLQQSVSIFP